MPDAHLTHPDLDPLARTVLDDYLAALAVLLPGPSRHTAGIIDEIDDGLQEATAAFLRQGLATCEAAHAAVAECGDPHT
ncbi:hypothetical protein HKK72_19980, partial [Actinomadura sp. HBU206391]|nr:hypothetical protein [Actinomadura sp. HBU206391]